MNALPPFRIGIDVGGTFTDFVLFRPDTGHIDSLKLLSTPNNPAAVFLEGLSIILNRNGFDYDGTNKADIVHGTTVATNVLLERKGSKTALITTAGFRDVLQIGRQNRPALYDLAADPPTPLIPEEQRLEVNERVDQTGSILEPLDPQDIQRVIQEIISSRIEAVAICLLFSFLNDQHEQALASAVRAAGMLTSVSSEVLPEFREYERTSTTSVNAYVSPVLKRYLDEIAASLSGKGKSIPASLRVMQSNGGAINIDEAGRFGVRCILSGPAGGVIGAQDIGRQVTNLFGNKYEANAAPRLITFDMGGTSTDVSLIEGSPTITTENTIGGHPIHIPMLDIHSIGAGGGSIARIDRGGALRVGPESAGAVPGPACYGRGSADQRRPTVTDANLVLARILPEYFLGGRMEIYPQLASQVFELLAGELHLDPIEAALGVIEVINAHMERALRVISVERGHDPQDFTLISFGGAGGLHATELARRLGIPNVIIPRFASTLSAFGLLAADVVKDYSRTVMLSGKSSLVDIDKMLEQLMERGIAEVSAEGVPRERILAEKLLDLRYRGQSYELTIAFREEFLDDFRQLHREVYGYDRPASEEIEIVNLRVRATGQVDTPQVKPRRLSDENPSHALIAYRPVYYRETPVSVPCFHAEVLMPGNLVAGPALIIRNDTVVLLSDGDYARVDAYTNILLTVGG
ncbi:MAG TPA: hydantoinase/oxoprolinase family protein [Anaerolineales bacterium]|nr:hydantoinase/oxoprolinase family protein [Anaerolineales bacterium]